MFAAIACGAVGIVDERHLDVGKLDLIAASDVDLKGGVWPERWWKSAARRDGGWPGDAKAVRERRNDAIVQDYVVGVLCPRCPAEDRDIRVHHAECRREISRCGIAFDLQRPRSANLPGTDIHGRVIVQDPAKLNVPPILRDRCGAQREPDDQNVCETAEKFSFHLNLQFARWRTLTGMVTIGNAALIKPV